VADANSSRRPRFSSIATSWSVTAQGVGKRTGADDPGAEPENSPAGSGPETAAPVGRKRRRWDRQAEGKEQARFRSPRPSSPTPGFERRVHYEGGVRGQLRTSPPRPRRSTHISFSEPTAANQSFAGPGQLDRWSRGSNDRAPNRRPRTEARYTAADDKFVFDRRGLPTSCPAFFDCRTGQDYGVRVTFLRGDDRCS